jgi:trans-aconitate methyltransferase
MNQDWNQQTVVAEYAKAGKDQNKNWYENAVNIPSIMRLLPNKRVSVLDFGCGPGDFTSQLAEKFETVGADSSEGMLAIARQQNPDINFIQWNGDSSYPEPNRTFDAIVTKLTLEFIENLPRLVKRFRSLVDGDGLMVVSVQHPLLAIFSHPDDDIPYWEMRKFEVQIGTTNNSVTKIHRSLQQYVEPFLQHGFSLTKIDEPEISKLLAEKFPVRPIDFKVPKRLNLQFSAV